MAGGDRLEFAGDGTSSLVYTTSATASNAGTIALGNDPVSFDSVEAIQVDQLASLERKLTGNTLTTKRQDQATIWDNWLVLVILVLVYSIDVGIRRLMGLS